MWRVERRRSGWEGGEGKKRGGNRRGAESAEEKQRGGEDAGEVAADGLLPVRVWQMSSVYLVWMNKPTKGWIVQLRNEAEIDLF
jgi:hypothetical protein